MSAMLGLEHLVRSPDDTKENGEGRGLELLEADLAELENSIFHLVRSNVELAQFLAEIPGDPDLEQALQENQGVLVKKRLRVKALRNAISDLRLANPHLAEHPSKTSRSKTRVSSRQSGVESMGNASVVGDGTAVVGVASSDSAMSQMEVSVGTSSLSASAVHALGGADVRIAGHVPWSASDNSGHIPASGGMSSGTGVGSETAGVDSGMATMNVEDAREYERHRGQQEQTKGVDTAAGLML